MQKSLSFLAGLAWLLIAAPAFAQADPDAETDEPEPAKPSKTAPAPPAAAKTPDPVAAPPPAVPAPPPTSAPAALTAPLQAIGALLEQPDAPPVGNTVAAPVFSEDRTPPGDPQHPKALHFGLHGYFRAPLRLGSRALTEEEQKARDEAIAAGEEPADKPSFARAPVLADDDYFASGFLYTPTAEADWTELYLSAGNEYFTGTVALEGTLYSDWARPIIDKQLGISKGWVTFRYGLDLPSEARLHLKVKGGAFSDRFGWQEKYDTYLFGRTHQMGEQVRADVDVGKFTFSALQGFGAHLDAIQSNQGLALLAYMRLGASYDKKVELSFYYLSTWAHFEAKFKDTANSSLDILGVEARADAGPLGRLVVDISNVSAEAGNFLSPSIELLHSAGGRGLQTNYFGTEKSNNGTGSLLNLGFQYDVSAGALLKKFADLDLFGEGDATLSLFGMYTSVTSDQVDPNPLINRDGRQLFKWGGEVAVWPLSFLGASLRYDRIIFDLVDDPSAFRVLSPRLTLRTHWIADATLFLQWSHYIYGERVGLRTDGPAGETKPDDDMVKIQAQLGF